MKVEKIYVALDFKSATKSVLSHALWLSQTFDCKKLCLFHIMEYTLTPPAYLMPYINKEKQKAEATLKSLVEEIAIYKLDADIKVVFGRLIESIKEVIKDEKAIAAIGFKTHITRPSTSERILKGLRIPVLIVKGEDFKEISPQAIKVKRILCPIDFSSYSLRALEIAKEVAKKWNCQLKVLHVVPEQKIKMIIEEPSEVEKYIENLREEASGEIEKIDKNLQYEILSGSPAEEILKKSKETDLIVLGSKGRSYTEAVIIGSVAEAVIKNSSTPVLLVH